MRGTATVAHRKWCADEGIALVGDLAPPTEGMLEDGDSDMDADDASLVEARRVRKEEAKLDKCVLMLINVRHGSLACGVVESVLSVLSVLWP